MGRKSDEHESHESHGGAVRRQQSGLLAWRGFTLLELLVVMGIISLLMAMLLPGLQWARRSAQRTACSSNLHQLALGLTNYLGDSDGFLPYFIPLQQKSDHGGPGRSGNGDDNSADLLSTLKKYVSDTRVFICPSDNTGVAEATGSSYDYWPGWLMWARELFKGDPATAVVRVVTKYYEFTPTKFPIFADAEGWHRPLDETGKNASWWDGSVSTLRDWTDPKWKK